MCEMWKAIEEVDNRYLISNTGNVYSKVSNKIMKPVEWGSGYYYVHLRNKDGKDFLFPIHRLVATYFIDNPNNGTQVNHINCDKHDNHYMNLEWVTPLENTTHAIENGLCYKRLKPVIKISEDGSEEWFSSIKAASIKTGINYDNIRTAIYRGCKAGGYYWIFDTKEVFDECNRSESI